MRILFVGHNSLLDNFVDYLGDKNEIVVLRSNKAQESRWKNVTIKIVSYPTFGFRLVQNFFNWELSPPSYIKNMKSVLNDINPDKIIVFDFYRVYFWQTLWLVRGKSNIDLYLYSETKQLPKNIFTRSIMRFFLILLKNKLDRVNKIFVFTKQGEQFLAEYLPVEKITLLPVPVDVDKFKPFVDKNWLPGNTLRILMNARYAPYKRHEDILDALNILREQGKKFHLTCIGRAKSGRDRIEKLATELRLNDCVTFLDPVPQEELPTIYHQHDALVLPSYNEAIGMVIPEAMACGLPTITSDTVGANVYVEEGETGFIFKTYDIDKLIEKLDKCYDIKHLKYMGSQASKKINRNYSVQIFANKFRKTVLDF